jgi:hypothetical protein
VNGCGLVFLCRKWIRKVGWSNLHRTNKLFFRFFRHQNRKIGVGIFKINRTWRWTLTMDSEDLHRMYVSKSLRKVNIVLWVFKHESRTGWTFVEKHFESYDSIINIHFQSNYPFPYFSVRWLFGKKKLSVQWPFSMKPNQTIFRSNNLPVKWRLVIFFGEINQKRF